MTLELKKASSITQWTEKSKESGKNFNSKVFCTAEAAGAAHRGISAKHMQNHATVLPNLAGKCQILHFFGFFAHCA